ncbi:MAG TPA: nucleotidyltransferase family protein [Candidatus Marinimicrobia bacterium]|nr:nucleotidyltransferase family protein [Candidatus Neomarinimicrobiota bacterium]
MSADAIVLAAGYSERAKCFKPLVYIGKKTILQHAIDCLRPFCENIIIVTGHNYLDIHNLFINDPQIILSRNKEYHKGMFSSVRQGLRHVSNERFFILPGDQPAIKIETIGQIAKCPGEIIQPRCNGKKGHPVLIHQKYIQEILAMPESRVLRDFMHAHNPIILDISDPGINMDADTPDDIHKLYNYMIKGFL